MAFKKDGTGEFKFSFRGINRVIDEKNNQFIRLSEIAWGVSDDEEVEPDKIKLDIRKFTNDADGKEKMLKGISFLTKDGPHELTHALVEEGYGNTEKILNGIKVRDDFPDAVRSSYGEKAKDLDDDTFDLRDLL